VRSTLRREFPDHLIIFNEGHLWVNLSQSI